MGGVVEGGVGITNRTSPRRASIEKVQAELRQEYDVREERKRELEFLEKGGNPLDFKFRNAASVSVQSTSFTDQHPDHFVTSEVKGSLAFTASPHGDSVESSGRRGAPAYEPNSADNLMLFDAEYEFSEGERKLSHPNRSKVAPSEQSSQVGGSQRDSAAFGLPSKAYKRRYRSRPNRDGTRSGSTDVNVNPSRGNQGNSFPSRHGLIDVKGLVTEAENQNISSNCSSKPTIPIEGAINKTVFRDGKWDMDLDGVKDVQSIKDPIEGVSVEATSDAVICDNAMNEQLNQQSPLDAVGTTAKRDSIRPEPDLAKEEIASAFNEHEPCVTASKVDIQCSPLQMNGFNSIKTDMMNVTNNNSASRIVKGLDSEPFCNQIVISVGVNNDSEMCTKKSNASSNGNMKNQKLVVDGEIVLEGYETVQEKKDVGVDNATVANVEIASAFPSQPANGSALQPEDELNRSESGLKNDMDDQCTVESGPSGSSERKYTVPSTGDPGMHIANGSNVKHESSIDISSSDIPGSGSLARVSTVSLDVQQASASGSKFIIEIDEDSILKEAQIIQAKRKRIAELSMAISPPEIHRRSHWDYVLEEMAWLANDFAQERIWKIAAAAHLCRQAASTCRLRKQEKSSCLEAKKVAHALAKSVLDFWDSAREESKELERQSEKDGTVSVRAYAIRFLKLNSSSVHDHVEVPSTPDRTSGSGILDLSWGDSFTEENLFYTVYSGAMETYRKSVEAHITSYERIGYSVPEEVATSACDVGGDYESHDIGYYEDEAETRTYDISVAFESSKSSRSGQKKRKHLTHEYGVRSDEIGSDLLPMQCAENKFAIQQSSLLAKRPGSSINVSIPTKRVRTASRRIISPFGGGTAGFIPVPNKTEVSSGETNSFQDDQSTLRAGSLVPNSLEVESVGDFEKQFPFDAAEVSTKPKKKKKAKHLNVAYEQRWQVDSGFENEQRDRCKKRTEGLHLESNGSLGLCNQPVIKKPNIMRQSQDNSFENITTIGGSIPSPAASQMSNMSNPNKFIKMLGSRGRKHKALKIPAGQQGSGSPWSLFEDQALVVLAHDLGPNWELVSDAINSTLHFKCIFRKAKECKERHKFLMDRTSGDGADSAEDSGSSQPYSSTLPGIPKGSARQLFQRLQGPMEEDIIKSNFEKIRMIGQKQHYRKSQDPKQLQQPHSSHTIALSQVCPNNLNGPILTPLDLCETSITGPDMLSTGFQGPHSSGLTISNQVTVAPMLPSSGAGATLQGTANVMLGNNFPSSPGSLSSSVSRDDRYAIPRSSSLSAEEQQRMQQYNHMMSGGNIPPPNISSPGTLPGSDRGVRILPGGNGLGMVCGVNRSRPMARSGHQGITSSSVVTSGSMIAPGIASATMHHGVGSGQGSPILKPRDALHMMRPGLSQDSQRQNVVPEIQIPVSSQGVSHFGGLSSPIPNQAASPNVPSHPTHHHQQSHLISPQQLQVLSPQHPHFQGSGNHSPNPQQQAYAIRMAKERRLQSRFLQQQPQVQQQQQQQFAATNSLMSQVPPQPQLPISSPIPHTSLIQPQTTTSPASIPPLTSASMNLIHPHQQKHPASSQGVARNSQSGGNGLTNQTGKQRQRQQQQFSQANRQHPQQRQQSQAQQQPKVAKGVGRSNLLMHQNISIDPSLINGVSVNTGNQQPDKGEPPSQLMQSQGLYSGAALHSVLPQRQYVSPQSSNPSLPQKKLYAGQASSSKHPQSMTHSDNALAVASGLSAAQSVPSFPLAGSSHQQASSHPKLGNQNQSPIQRAGQVNRQLTSDSSSKPQIRDCDFDQHQESGTADMDTLSTLPQMTNSAATVVQVVSPASANQWHASESLLDSNALNSTTNLSTFSATPSNSSESVPQTSRGLGQRPSSTNITPIRHDGSSSQWQQPSQAQPQPPPPPIQQAQQQQSQQLLQPLHSQQQAQLLKAGNGNLYVRTSGPRLE